MDFYTYLYRDIDNTPIYVGKGTKNRATHHFRSKTHLGCLLRKRYKEGYKIEPVFLCKDVDEELAFFVEIEMIRHYGRKDLGTGSLLNRTNGGEGHSGFIQSEETKAKRRKSCTGLKRSDETKQRMSQRQIGSKNARYGKKPWNSGIKMPYIAQPIVTCPHCNKAGGQAAMKRWHFNNCKFKEKINVI